jgi:hypothetical protein
VAAGASVGASVATAVAGACVAGGCVAAGAAVVAGAPQEESSRDVKTSRLAKDHNMDLLFISLSPYYRLEYGFELNTGLLFWNVESDLLNLECGRKTQHEC